MKSTYVNSNLSSNVAEIEVLLRVLPNPLNL